MLTEFYPFGSNITTNIFVSDSAWPMSDPWHGTSPPPTKVMQAHEYRNYNTSKWRRCCGLSCVVVRLYAVRRLFLAGIGHVVTYWSCLNARCRRRCQCRGSTVNMSTLKLFLLNISVLVGYLGEYGCEKYLVA
jgi:hypothetical protein